MKPLIPHLLVLVLFASACPVIAQSDMIILQKAKNLRDANNAQQGVPPASTPAPAPPAPPVATPSPVALEIKSNLDRVAVDLAAIKSGAGVSSDQKNSLQNDLLALSRGSVKPSHDALAKLAGDLSGALSGGDVSSGERSQLAGALCVILNSSMTTPVQAQKSIQTAQDSLKSSGVSDVAVQAVADDFKSILAGVQKKTPKLYQ